MNHGHVIGRAGIVRMARESFVVIGVVVVAAAASIRWTIVVAASSMDVQGRHGAIIGQELSDAFQVGKPWIIGSGQWPQEHFVGPFLSLQKAAEMACLNKSFLVVLLLLVVEFVVGIGIVCVAVPRLVLLLPATVVIAILGTLSMRHSILCSFLIPLGTLVMVGTLHDDDRKKKCL